MKHPPKLQTFVKPTIRMHEDQWDGTEYNLYSPRLEPRGPDALPPPIPKDEYSLGNVLSKEANIFAEYTGLYGFVAKSAYQGRSPHPAEHKNPRAGATSREPHSWSPGVHSLLACSSWSWKTSSSGLFNHAMVLVCGMIITTGA
jgi:hypothetical protein